MPSKLSRLKEGWWNSGAKSPPCETSAAGGGGALRGGARERKRRMGKRRIISTSFMSPKTEHQDFLIPHGAPTLPEKAWGERGGRGGDVPKSRHKKRHSRGMQREDGGRESACGTVGGCVGAKAERGGGWGNTEAVGAQRPAHARKVEPRAARGGPAARQRPAAKVRLFADAVSARIPRSAPFREGRSGRGPGGGTDRDVFELGAARGCEQTRRAVPPPAHRLRTNTSREAGPLTPRAGCAGGRQRGRGGRRIEPPGRPSGERGG